MSNPTNPRHPTAIGKEIGYSLAGAAATHLLGHKELDQRLWKTPKVIANVISLLAAIAEKGASFKGVREGVIEEQ
jgi:hypothetical protein